MLGTARRGWLATQIPGRHQVADLERRAAVAQVGVEGALALFVRGRAGPALYAAAAIGSEPPKLSRTSFREKLPMRRVVVASAAAIKAAIGPG